MFVSRRQGLSAATCGFGSLALADLMNPSKAAGPNGVVASSGGDGAVNPLAPKPSHHPAAADNFIFLHMRGGPSAMESYERKPELDKRAADQSKADGEKKGRKLTPSHWNWKRRGESGLWVSDLFKHTAEWADELCVLSGMHTDIGNHTPAMLQLHTGSFTFPAELC